MLVGSSEWCMLTVEIQTRIIFALHQLLNPRLTKITAPANLGLQLNFLPDPTQHNTTHRNTTLSAAEVIGVRLWPCVR